jgi:NADH:ubiquinone reductase (non-electrogenic)
MGRMIRDLPTTRAFDKLVRGGGGRLRLQADKPVVLVLGSGWGAHSLMKVGVRVGALPPPLPPPCACVSG